RDIRVIMLTARSDEVSKIQALESGADDFLLKPFSSIELIARVRSCLREADLRNDLRDQNVYLKKTLADLESTRLQLVHSEKMAGIGCLASGILHEINNPLNYMLTALDLGIGSANRLDSGNLPDLLADVKRGAERIQEIVSNLGVFALSENSDRKSPCAMGELASKAVQMLPPDLPRNRITVDIPGDLVIVGFQTQLVHVLLNLLRNAMDAVSGDSYRDRAKVILRASRMDSDKIRVSVEDNGCGIPESNMKRIFEPFFTTKDVNQGTGLGLSVCHSIIKAHGSDLAVRSRVGEGSCFSFELPDKDIC
ncbi:MAG TPA: HAMP domain-containing sensor histidine kinase, partial [Opitutales bacterium]|nr:HAMP domain-containing sensor histidine kinase [Opitutales bacterium]